MAGFLLGMDVRAGLRYAPPSTNGGLVLPVSLTESIENWVQAIQVIDRVPAWPDDEQQLYDAVIKQAPLWLEANRHEVAIRQHGRAEQWAPEDFQVAFDEVGVPISACQSFFRRQSNRQTDYFVHPVGTDQKMHVSTWFIPFGFFTPPGPKGEMPPPFVEGVIVESLRELFSHLGPFIKLLEAVNDPLAIAPQPVFMNLRQIESMGWTKEPFCLWPAPTVLSYVNFKDDPLHTGVLTLPLVAATEEALGVLEDMAGVLLKKLTEQGLGFFRFVGEVLPRHEAYECAAVETGRTWAKLVFCSSSRSRGTAEFFFAKGTPNRLQASVRLRDSQGNVTAMLIHSIGFYKPESLAQIMEPWMSPQASHLSWQFSSAASADYTDPRLASLHPFW